MLKEQHGPNQFEHGMQVGKSHTLLIRHAAAKVVAVKRHGQQIIATLPIDTDPSSASVQRHIRNEVLAAYRLEAKSYLPKRLAFLAEKHGFNYEKVRFSHASGRWGSCNSHGTISLNIALMKLPFELIDYVLVHELSHTREMNHSQNFWAHVATADPDYKIHRRNLKNETPSI